MQCLLSPAGVVWRVWLAPWSPEKASHLDADENFPKKYQWERGSCCRCGWAFGKMSCEQVLVLGA